MFIFLPHQKEIATKPELSHASCLAYQTQPVLPGPRVASHRNEAAIYSLQVTVCVTEWSSVFSGAQRTSLQSHREETDGVAFFLKLLSGCPSVLQCHLESLESTEVSKVSFSFEMGKGHPGGNAVWFCFTIHDPRCAFGLFPFGIKAL